MRVTALVKGAFFSFFVFACSTPPSNVEGIVGEARGGSCHLRVKSLTPYAYELDGEGFEPGEEVRTLYQGTDFRLPGKEIINSDGRVGYQSFGYAPGTSGTASFTVFSRLCTITVEYTWGQP